MVVLLSSYRPFIPALLEAARPVRGTVPFGEVGAFLAARALANRAQIASKGNFRLGKLPPFQGGRTRASQHPR